MKPLSYLLAGLIFALSAGLAQAESVNTSGKEDFSGKPKYISWTWDDIED